MKKYLPWSILFLMVIGYLVAVFVTVRHSQTKLHQDAFQQGVEAKWRNLRYDANPYVGDKLGRGADWLDGWCQGVQNLGQQ